jgi:hypothetical protein
MTSVEQISADNKCLRRRSVNTSHVEGEIEYVLGAIEIINSRNDTTCGQPESQIWEHPCLQ